MAKGWEVVVGLCGVEEGGRESEGGYRRHRDQQPAGGQGGGTRARERERLRAAGTSTIEVEDRRSGMQDIRAEKIEYPVGEEQLFQLNLPATCK
jgi:hypothetical protein